MNVLERAAERPGLVVDAGLAVVFAAVLVVEGRVIADRDLNWGFEVAIGALVCVAALLRGHSRTRAAAAGLAIIGGAELVAWHWDQLPSQPGGAAILAFFVLTGSVVRAVAIRPALAIVAGGALVTAGSLERYLYFIQNDIPVSYSGTWFMGTGWGLAIGVGLWLRILDARRVAALEGVRRAERLELARELHDSAAHHITGIVLQAQAARIAARKHPESLDDSLADIESAGTEALDAMRQVIGLLRDGDDAGGRTAGPEQLADLVERFAGRGPAVRLRLPDGPVDPGWPPEVTATVCRVVQEALTNVTRHAAAAREVTVALTHDQRVITVEITDDAPPSASARFPGSGGYGLVGMRERVEALGGTLTAGPRPRPRTGWSVLATLPTPGRP